MTGFIIIATAIILLTCLVIIAMEYIDISARGYYDIGYRQGKEDAFKDEVAEMTEIIQERIRSSNEIIAKQQKSHHELIRRIYQNQQKQ